MGTAIILILIISVFGTGMAMYTFQPSLLSLGYDGQFWNNNSNINTDVEITRDTLYSASLAMPIIVMGVLALWAILAMTRKDDL